MANRCPSNRSRVRMSGCVLDENAAARESQARAAEASSLPLDGDLQFDVLSGRLDRVDQEDKRLAAGHLPLDLHVVVAFPGGEGAARLFPLEEGVNHLVLVVGQ